MFRVPVSLLARNTITMWFFFIVGGRNSRRTAFGFTPVPHRSDNGLVNPYRVFNDPTPAKTILCTTNGNTDVRACPRGGRWLRGKPVEASDVTRRPLRRRRHPQRPGTRNFSPRKFVRTEKIDRTFFNTNRTIVRGRGVD